MVIIIFTATDVRAIVYPSRKQGDGGELDEIIDGSGEKRIYGNIYVATADKIG